MCLSPIIQNALRVQTLERAHCGPYETRTRVSALRGRRPGPLDEWAAKTTRFYHIDWPCQKLTVGICIAIIPIMLNRYAQLPEHIVEYLLGRVEKPSRYAGGELNSIAKDWDSCDVSIALAFPEVYDIGMSNLALSILYSIVNQHEGYLAERVFSPWPDMEDELRHNQIPLFSLESRRDLREFDVIGLFLPYEQLYTNALNLLDLAGLPVLAINRDGPRHVHLIFRIHRKDGPVQNQ